MPSVDPHLFTDAAVSDETRALNAEIVAKLSALPDTWSIPPAVVRDRRAKGLGPFPLAPRSARARMVTIEGKHGPIDLRIIEPANGEKRGAFLHIHGGGWVLGACDQQDPFLERIADTCGVVAVSVDYRLAPENPYPRGPDDCEAAALWLVGAGARDLGVERFAIGGESAGAHLSAVTLLRLRDRHGMTPFSAALLNAGIYDLGLTPSMRRFGTERLILTTRDAQMFVRHFLVHGGDVADPDISPIHADLSGMPPALFTIGTRDGLLDDSLFMAARWEAAGGHAELAVHPGGAHVFQNFDSALTRASLERITGFLSFRVGNG